MLNPKSLGIAGGLVFGFIGFVVGVCIFIFYSIFDLSKLVIFITKVPFFSLILIGTILAFAIGYFIYYLVAVIYDRLELID